MNSYFFVLITLVLSLGIVPAFAESISVSIPEGTSVSGCETSNECYIPYEITIDVGDKVTWLNNDMAFHTVTSGSSADGPHDVFDSGMFKINEEFSHEFDESGNFSYFCTLHPWMDGVVVVQEVLAEEETENNGGGCLIATAAYGSELDPQIQQLRELRDNQLLNSKSGTIFMTSFNDFYYSFSPHIADYERENPLFREAIKLAITPMISSLSILNYVELDSESKVLGYGISMLLLNFGMYVGIPASIIIGIKKKF